MMYKQQLPVIFIMYFFCSTVTDDMEELSSVIYNVTLLLMTSWRHVTIILIVHTLPVLMYYSLLQDCECMFCIL